MVLRGRDIADEQKPRAQHWMVTDVVGQHPQRDDITTLAQNRGILGDGLVSDVATTVVVKGLQNAMGGEDLTKATHG